MDGFGTFGLEGMGVMLKLFGGEGVDAQRVSCHGHGCSGGLAVTLSGVGHHIQHGKVIQIFAVAIPVAIETGDPAPGDRHADFIVFPTLCGEVGDDQHVVVSTAVLLPQEGDYLVAVINVVDGDVDKKK